MNSRLPVVVRTLALVLLGGVGSSFPASAADPPAGGQRSLVVFAAASLRESLTELGATFERAHPGVKVQFNFAGSQELRTQLEQGAPADVFISADRRHMEGVRTAGLTEPDTLLATNVLVVVTPAANPAQLKALQDLPRAKRLVIGAPEVPVGKYSLEMLDKANGRFGPTFRSQVEARVVSRELNVKQVLTKVQLGEADAGIVYRTDAASAGDKVGVIAIPAELNVTAVYPMAVLKKAPQPQLARDFVQLLGSAAGQAVLAKYGFGPPGEITRR